MSATRAVDALGESLKQNGHRRGFRHGQSLFVEGDRAERVFVIEHGWVLLSCTAASGREIVLGVCGPGDVIGELSSFDGEPRSATALALGDVEAVVAPSAELTRALEDPSAARELIRVLAARLRDGDRKRLEFASRGTLGRVAWRLLELSDRFGEPADDGVSVALPLSQEQLASWCGASREATVKALRSLRSFDCISTGRRHVVIRDLEALHRYADGRA
jgi:CRP-like cAMP-binding protein